MKLTTSHTLFPTKYTVHLFAYFAGEREYARKLTHGFTFPNTLQQIVSSGLCSEGHLLLQTCLGTVPGASSQTQTAFGTVSEGYFQTKTCFGTCSGVGFRTKTYFGTCSEGTFHTETALGTTILTKF